MKQTIFISLILLSQLSALSLSEVRSSIKTSAKFQAIESKNSAAIALNKAQMSNEAASLLLDLGYAKEELGQKGLEYQVSLSQNLKNPFLQREKTKYNFYTKDYYTTKELYQQSLLEYEAIEKYHLACIEKERFEYFQTLLENENEIVQKLQDAFTLGEISKKTLMFHQLEFLKLAKSKKEYYGLYEQSLLSLQEYIESETIASLECNDLYEISSMQQKGQMQDHRKYRLLFTQKKLSELDLSFSQSILPSFTYSFGYEKELDKDRYGLSVSIPLQFWGTQQKEYEQSYLKRFNTNEKELESFVKTYQTEESQYLQALQNRYQNYVLYSKELLPLAKELHELSTIALYEGEGSNLEALDALRSYKENILEFIEIKKIYYRDLFTYYKKMDLQPEEKR